MCVSANANGLSALSLVDNGSEAVLIDRSFLRAMNVKPKSLAQPIPLFNPDGSLHSTLSQFASVRFSLGRHSERLFAYVCDIPHYKVILGDPWLKLHNPKIDWAQRTLEFRKCAASLGCCEGIVTIQAHDPPRTQLPRQHQVSVAEEDEELLPEVKQISAVSFTKEMTDPKNAFSVLLPCEAFTTQDKADQLDREILNIRIAAIGTKQPKFSEDDFRRHMAGPQTKSDHQLRELIPELYHEFIDVFDRNAADQLPPHREGVDHEIHLIPGTETNLPHVRNYWSLSPREQEAVAKYILENSSKGFIRPSTSPVAAPVLVVRKPGGGLRVCVDYRGLNKITVKSRYPIPLINETLNLLSKARIYSKFDVIHAFNRIRIKSGHEYLTAFNTRFGQFEYLVLPFGLCNGPSTFQQFINTTLQEYLDIFVTAYLDDVLVYSANEKDHITHVKKVFSKLRDANLQLDIDKSVFHTTSVKYLGLIISIDGIQMDPAKLQAISDWAHPKSVGDVLAWLGFCNFYRQFIPGYSSLAAPFYELTKGKVVLSKTGRRVMRYAPFEWSDTLATAFNAMKAAFAKAHVLAHYDPFKPTVIETDASDFITAGVLSQEHDGVLKPVAFFSKKMSPTQWNYAIYDKELLAIVRCLEEWRPELMGLAESFTIKTDHQSLEYFMTTKKLTARQARWAEFLSSFRFIIRYNPGKNNKLADTLTRRSQDDVAPGTRIDTVLKPHNLDASLRASIHALSTGVPTTLISCDYDIRRALCALHLSVTNVDNTNSSVSVTPSPRSISDDMPAPDSDEPLFPTTALLPDTAAFQAAYQTDPILMEAVDCCQRRVSTLPPHVFKALRVSMPDLTTFDGLLFHHNRLLVPQADDLRLRILDYYHQSRFFGHPGEKVLFDLITRVFYWPRLRQDISTYVRACYTCRRAKSSNNLPSGLLQPLPPPSQPWQDITMDLAEALPRSVRRGRAYQHMLIVVDRLTKDRVLEPLTSKTASEIAEALHRRIFCCYGFPRSIVSDRGSAFVGDLLQSYCRTYKIKWKCSTAFHPQTDGQSENGIKQVKKFLRMYINFAQDDWPDYLPDAEFAARISVSETTGTSPFFALYGFHPTTPGEGLIPRFPTQSDSATYPDRARQIHEWLGSSIVWAQDRQAQFANAHRRQHPRYSIGDKVFVDARHFANDRTSKSLGYKFIGPCRITRVIDNKAYQVELPVSLAQAGVTDVFHPDRLAPAPARSFPGQHTPEQPPVFVSDGDGTYHREWEVSEIVDCRRNAAGGVEYRAKFVGDWPEWNSRPPWQPWTDFVNSPQKVLDYHALHPRKPPPPSHFT